tara:strand:+ start:1271 stop:1897 length:627 start_codon:yes stop_codon:yes gene_type:complete
MGVNLQKGQAVSLTKANNGNKLSKVTMGLGWDAYVWEEKRSGGFLGLGGKKTGERVKVERDVDLDASCVTMDENGTILETVYFGNLKNNNQSIVHTGDNRTGDGDGDDEQIRVDLDSLPANVKTVVFTVNAFCGVTFNDVHNSYCRLLDNNGKEIVKFPMDSSGNHTAMIMAKVVRQANGDWEFTAIGEKASGRTVRDLSESVQSIVR